MKRLLIGICLTVVSVVAAAASPTKEEQQIMEASKAVVQVHVQNVAYGSGWFIDEKTVVTNCHVVDENPHQMPIYIILNPEKQREAHKELVVVLSCDVLEDIAILQIVGEYKSPNVLPVFDNKVNSPYARFDDVWSVGYPSALPQVITHGHYQYTFNDDQLTYEAIITTSPIFHGNSGGPLLWIDPKTNVVTVIGMTSATLSKYPHICVSVLAENILAEVHDSRTGPTVEEFTPPYLTRN